MKSQLRNAAGMGLIEVMIALGLMTIIGAGITTLVLSGNKGQKNLELKQDSQGLMNEIQLVLSNTNNCTNSIAQIKPPAAVAAGGVAKQNVDITLPGGQVMNVGKTYGSGGLDISELNLTIQADSGNRVQRTNPSNVMTTYREQVAILNVRTGKTSGAEQSSSGPAEYAEKSFSFKILVDNSTNQAHYCSMDSGASFQETCTDMLDGVYDTAAPSPKCLMRNLYLGGNFPATNPGNAAIYSPGASGDLVFAPATGKSLIIFNRGTNQNILRYDSVGKTFAFTGNAATDTTIQVDGSITATGTITASSDIRMKKNITPILNALEKVSQISGVQFYYKKDTHNEYPQLGFVAQDLQKVAPELVRTDKNGYLSVAYGNATALLVEALKEQQKQIEALRLEVQQLKKTSPRK